MGKFAAVLPGDLRYCTQPHVVPAGADGVHRFGFTAYAVRLMQDVYFLDWCVSAGDGARAEAADRPHRDVQGGVRPVRPDRRHADDVQRGSAEGPVGDQRRWLRARLAVRDGRRRDGTLDVQEYHDFLAANWDKTQRMLKGQMGTK